ncbi:hypothetical protein [Streptomyces sp. NPDC005538]|uniref:hypothetical protein n=1 Tax=unclassified Streptomyces TaxID=2593676 RepID=UPI0033AF41FF
MNWIIALAWTVWGLMVLVGIAAVRNYWILPWLRTRVVRPWLWGYGALLACAGMAVGLAGGPTAHSVTVDNISFGATMVLLIGGFTLQHLGQRPGRVRP